jgi:signal transduction histidine kinase
MVSIADPFKAIASWFTPSSKGKDIIKILEQIAKGNFSYKVKIARSEKDQEHRQILRGLRLTLKELKKMEEKEQRQRSVILKANKQLQQLDKNKREFMELASHQLKTPLASMQLGLDLLKRKSQNWQKDDVVILDQINSSYAHLSKLVKSLLAAVRIEERVAMEPKVHMANLNQLIDALDKQFKNRFEENGIEFKIIGPEKSIKLKTDAEFLIEILHNLLENSLKYTKNGFVEMQVKVNVDKVEFRVKDSGIGVSIDEQKKIFEKMFRASNVKNMSDPGSGLGLYYTKQLVKKLGGKIWFDSEEGKGSTFYVSLPR